jgi:hypothetical protein
VAVKGMIATATNLDKRHNTCHYTNAEK